MRLFVIAFGMLVIVVIGIAGFRGDTSRKPPLEIFPDMDRQLKVRPQEPNPFFKDGRASRPYPKGTVPTRTTPITVNGVDVYPFEDHPVNTGIVTGTTNYVDFNMRPIDLDVLRRGQERYNISCQPCHGMTGDGEGIVKHLGWAVIRNLHEPAIVQQPDGELFATISVGKNTMSGYANKISIEDRWAIVAYLRALQLSRLGGKDDLSDADRAQLFPAP